MNLAKKITDNNARGIAGAVTVGEHDRTITAVLSLRLIHRRQEDACAAPDRPGAFIRINRENWLNETFDDFVIVRLRHLLFRRTNVGH